MHFGIKRKRFQEKTYLIPKVRFLREKTYPIKIITECFIVKNTILMQKNRGVYKPLLSNLRIQTRYGIVYSYFLYCEHSYHSYIEN